MLIKLVDFGLVVLIWMTQLVVYPSFTYFSESDLVAWHSRYTQAITLIVMPLMVAQVGLHLYGMYHDFSWLKVLAFSLIVLVWINTFGFAVPLHNQIASGSEVMQASKKLVATNWFRTILWTLVFLIGFFNSTKSSFFS